MQRDTTIHTTEDKQGNIFFEKAVDNQPTCLCRPRNVLTTRPDSANPHAAKYEKKTLTEIYIQRQALRLCIT